MGLSKALPGARDSTYRQLSFSNLYHHLPDTAIHDILESPPVYPDGPDDPTHWRRHHGWLDDYGIIPPPEKPMDRMKRELKNSMKEAYKEVMGELIALKEVAEKVCECDDESVFGANEGQMVLFRAAAPIRGARRAVVGRGRDKTVCMPRHRLVMTKISRELRDRREAYVVRKAEKRRREHEQVVLMLAKHAAFMRRAVACPR